MDEESLKERLSQEEKEWIEESKKQLGFNVKPPSIPKTSSVLSSSQRLAKIDEEILKNLKEDNERLLFQLGEANAELQQLRKLKNTASEFIVPETADLKEKKIVDLAKKNRDLRMNLAKVPSFFLFSIFIRKEELMLLYNKQWRK
jgi:hypothetical protein